MAGQIAHPAWQRLRQQPVTLVTLVVITALCWWYLFAMAADMADMKPAMPMPFHSWSADYFLLMLVMWIVMMVGMMLPSALPMILLYRHVVRHQALPWAETGVALFAAGYLLVWTLFSLAATALQWQLEKLALLSPMLVSSSVRFSAAVLILAGLYQWSRWKESCLRWCQGPLAFVSRHWQPGPTGALRMGLRHGAYCTGCCWLLMAMLFVGGVMDLTVIAAIALLVLLEKLLPAGRYVARTTGVLAIGYGLILLLG